MMGFTFPFLEYGPETPNDWLGVSRRVYRFREYTNSEYFGDRDLFGLVLNDNQTENGDIGLRLYQKLKANCEELLNQYANGAEITKCDQWEPFYDCVAEAIVTKIII
ncbi:unnamed protein product [Orchesella dallaii]|uniref:Uncharacterized protein n=1 Tax=Orchesella dallaii TaxID=48710 RepID=A0ABP1RGY1_9HEXA